MRVLNLREKTGFKILNPYKPVNIRDFRGLMFYTTEYLLPKVKEFNLPKGRYLVEGEIKPLPFPVNFPLYPLPPRERNRRFPFDFKIRVKTNPNKCTIFWDKKEIVFDPAIMQKPLPVIDFIRFHEYGHARYTTEVYCDLMAANFMLKKGYNPSQIRETPILTLSDKQKKRKFDFYNLTK